MLSKQYSYIIKNMAVFGIVHALVDAACAAVNFGSLKINHLDIGYFASLIILYNVLSFALQPLLGLLIDKLKKPSLAAATGCVFVIVSIFTIKMPIISICFAGFGNALFHVGGGIITLELVPGKSSLPGIFVAPGALGLLIGILIGKGGSFPVWSFVLPLILSSFFIIAIRKNEKNSSAQVKNCSKKLELIISLLFFSIILRSLIGMVLDFPWKSNIYLLFILTGAVVLGKALGGILSDRFGWIRVTVIGLVASAPLIYLGFDYPAMAIAGIFLFNLTMPVTLTAIFNMLPQWPGFSFGLTTLALIIGAFPSFTILKNVLYSRYIVIILILLMSYILYKGLKLYFSSLEISYKIAGGEYNEKIY